MTRRGWNQTGSGEGQRRALVGRIGDRLAVRTPQIGEGQTRLSLVETELRQRLVQHHDARARGYRMAHGAFAAALAAQ